MSQQATKARGVHALRVPINNGDEDHYTSPDFEAAGHTWRISVHPDGELDPSHPTDVGAMLYASGKALDDHGSNWKRHDVEFSISLVNLKWPAKSRHGKTMFCFHDTEHGWGFPALLPSDEALLTVAGFLDAEECLHFIVDITATKGGSAPDQQQVLDLTQPPPESLSGDTEIVLDGGKSLQAHAAYLEQASEVLKGALRCVQPTASGQPASGKKRKSLLASEPELGSAAHTLPMTGVTTPQALLLLHCLYAFDRRAWVVGVGFQDLCDLVRVCDKFACCGVLQLVDKTLLERAEAGEGDAGDEASMLNVANAPAHHKLASRYRLSAYEAHVARFLGLNADRVDLAALDPSLAHALRGANEMRSKLFASMFPIA